MNLSVEVFISCAEVLLNLDIIISKVVNTQGVCCSRKMINDAHKQQVPSGYLLYTTIKIF